MDTAILASLASGHRKIVTAHLHVCSTECSTLQWISQMALSFTTGAYSIARNRSHTVLPTPVTASLLSQLLEA